MGALPGNFVTVAVAFNLTAEIGIFRRVAFFFL